MTSAFTSWYRAGAAGGLAIVLVLAATGCGSDVVCEEAGADGSGLCSVKSDGDCGGTVHEMTEGDKELTGTRNRGSDTCKRLGYTAPYLGGYMKVRGN